MNSVGSSDPDGERARDQKTLLSEKVEARCLDRWGCAVLG